MDNIVYPDLTDYPHYLSHDEVRQLIKEAVREAVSAVCQQRGEPVGELEPTFPAGNSNMLGGVYKLGFFSGQGIPVYTAPQPAETRNDGFDKWLENPYTKALEKSIKEDYVPQPAAPAQEPSVPGYTVMDRGFLYENGKHIPTLLLAFPMDDWDSRDLMAAMLAAAPTPPTKEGK